MSNSLEEVLNEYLSLKEQELHLDASVQLTKAIREIYFEDNELWKSPLFALMVETERKNITDLIESNNKSFHVEYNHKRKEWGNIIFSNVNTFLLIKLQKNNTIEFTDSPIRLLKKEQQYSDRGIWSTVLKEAALSTYLGELNSEKDIEMLLRLIELNIYEFKGIKEEVNGRGSLLHYEQYILQAIEDDLRNNQLQSLLKYGLASLVILNWYLEEINNFKDLLMKLVNISSEEDHLFWLYKFLEKEYILSEQ